MAHKTLISGTAYSVTGGRELIGGTGYGCKAGKTLIGGTAFDVPFSKDVPLSTVTPGAILMLNESGSDAQFSVAKHDYEADLNGVGLTLIVKKGIYGPATAFGTSETRNSYVSSVINEKLKTYASTVIDERIREVIRTTKIPVTKGNTDQKIDTEKIIMDTKCFILSCTELGYASNTSIFNVEGTKLPNAEELRIAGQWTRTPYLRSTYDAFYVKDDLNGTTGLYISEKYIVPAFTLPATLAVVQNADGTYSLAA